MKNKSAKKEHLLNQLKLNSPMASKRNKLFSKKKELAVNHEEQKWLKHWSNLINRTTNDNESRTYFIQSK